METWTDEHTRRLNQACEARKAEGFCDGSCLFIGWCDWVYEDVRRADARREGQDMRYALDYDEQDHRALMIARTRPVKPSQPSASELRRRAIHSFRSDALATSRSVV